MSNRDKWRLCGGTFFILISDARNPMPSHAEMYMGKQSGITEPETLLALARVVTPGLKEPMHSEAKSFRDGTLDFKACEGWGWKQFLFRDASAKTSFDERIKNSYSECLANMTGFTNKYLQLRTKTKKDVYLVKALLELLDADDSIQDDKEFYAKKNGTTATKSELLSASSICLESFLLGLWHYCIVDVKKNSIGKETYAEWCPPTEGNNERPYVAAVGENSKRNIKLTYCEKSEFENMTSAEKPYAPDEPEPEIVDAVPEKEEQSVQQNLNQAINQPRVFNIHMEQSGSGTQNAYIENYYEKRKED